MTHGNCWLFALRRWLEEGPADSYIIFRKSRHTCVLHAMWAPSIDGLYVEEFKPVDMPKAFWPKMRWLVVHLWGLWFRGRVRRGQGEEHNSTWFGPRT